MRAFVSVSSRRRELAIRTAVGASGGNLNLVLAKAFADPCRDVSGGCMALIRDACFERFSLRCTDGCRTVAAVMTFCRCRLCSRVCFRRGRATKVGSDGGGCAMNDLKFASANC